MTYRKVSSGWIKGRVGRALRGDADAYTLAYYLMTAEENVKGLGIFWQPLPCIGILYGMPIDRLSIAYDKLTDLGFAWYYTESEIHFVTESARHEWGEVPNMGSRAVQGMQKTLLDQLDMVRKCPSFRRWLDRYASPWAEVLEPLASGTDRLSIAYRKAIDSPDPIPEPSPDPDPSPEPTDLAPSEPAPAGASEQISNAGAGEPAESGEARFDRQRQRTGPVSLDSSERTPSAGTQPGDSCQSEDREERGAGASPALPEALPPPPPMIGAAAERSEDLAATDKGGGAGRASDNEQSDSAKPPPDGNRRRCLTYDAIKQSLKDGRTVTYPELAAVEVDGPTWRRKGLIKAVPKRGGGLLKLGRYQLFKIDAEAWEADPPPGEPGWKPPPEPTTDQGQVVAYIEELGMTPPKLKSGQVDYGSVQQWLKVADLETLKLCLDRLQGAGMSSNWRYFRSCLPSWATEGNGGTQRYRKPNAGMGRLGAEDQAEAERMGF